MINYLVESFGKRKIVVDNYKIFLLLRKAKMVEKAERYQKEINTYLDAEKQIKYEEK